MKKALSALLMVFSIPLCANATEVSYMSRPNRTEWQAGGFYEGVFEDGTPFQLNLPYPMPKSIQRKEWEPTSLNASYWYPRRFSGETILLKLKSFQDNAFTIAGIAADKEGRSIEKEIFEGILSPDRMQATGVWTHIKGKKLTFTMSRTYEYRGVDLTLTTEAGRGYKPERPFIFSVIFPVFGESKVDRSITNIVSECEQDLECRNTVQVAWFSKASFSLTGSIWGYSEAMAHGNGYAIIQNYVTASSAPKHVALDHFINTSPGCLDRVSQKIVSALKKKGLSRAEDGTLQDWKHAKFLPTPLGILFDFDTYEVGAYVEGIPTVFIERGQFGKCLKDLPHHE